MVLLPLVLLLDATLVSGITPKLDGLKLAPTQLIDPDQPNDNDKLTAVSLQSKLIPVPKLVQTKAHPDINQSQN